MLVLSRRPGESVMIGDQITVTVVEVRGDQIRIGIDAPRSVKVYREEIFRQVVAENEAAARSTDPRSPLLRRAAPPRHGD